MIHKACMPVYMNSGRIVADGRDRTGQVGKSKVLQEVLADLKIVMIYLFSLGSCSNRTRGILVNETNPVNKSDL